MPSQIHPFAFEKHKQTGNAKEAASVHAAYKLLRIFVGFPQELFEFKNSIQCKDENDPRFKAFYVPRLCDIAEEGHPKPSAAT